MQSFGEGLDLPGRLCESVFITKLPFAPPDDPVGEARAEWLRAVGATRSTNWWCPPPPSAWRNGWAAPSAPRKTMAHVYCYDKRLVATSYGPNCSKACHLLRWKSVLLKTGAPALDTSALAAILAL